MRMISWFQTPFYFTIHSINDRLSFFSVFIHCTNVQLCMHSLVKIVSVYDLCHLWLGGVGHRLYRFVCSPYEVLSIGCWSHDGRLALPSEQATCRRSSSDSWARHRFSKRLWLGTLFITVCEKRWVLHDSFGMLAGGLQSNTCLASRDFGAVCGRASAFF